MKHFDFTRWRWPVRGAGWTLLLLATVWLGQRVQAARVEHEQRQQIWARVPAELSAEAALDKMLSEQEAAIEQLRRLVVRRAEVGQVVGVMEQMARQRQLEVVLTDIREEGQAAASGPLRDVRLAGTVTGTPASLLSWLVAVEQLPYVLHLADWKLQLVERPSSGLAVGVAPETEPAAATVTAEGTFTFMLGIQNEAPTQP